MEMVHRKHATVLNGTTAPLCVVTVIVPLYVGLSLPVCDCRRFSASVLWICVIFGHGKVVEDWC